MLTKAELTRLRSLREKKHRDGAGVFVVEGEKVVRELLAAHVPLLEVYTTDPLPPAPARAGSAPAPPRWIAITPQEMARISHFPTPSSLLAIGPQSRAELTPGELNRGLTLALDGIQDAGNLGTLLRIADWFALDRVLCSPHCVDRFHQKVINASMGSFCRVRVVVAPLPEALAEVTVPVLGCDLTGSDVHTLPAWRDAVILIGSEGRGLSPATRERVTHFATIPRYGSAESLNAGIAAAIVCDNLRRAGATPLS